MSVKSLFCLLFFATFSVSVGAATFTIDSGHTYPSLEFPHMVLSIWRGKFNNTTGKVVLDQKEKTGSVDISVNIASIDFGHDEMNKHAVSADWLNGEKFPLMTYKGKLVFDGDKPIKVDGNLTLRGITKPLQLTIKSFACVEEHPFYKKEVCGADAVGELNRADFGMAQYTQNGMGIVKLRIQVEAIKDD